ncbi:MAG TPA: glycerophosphodiester phosphodiesterase [Gemmatimonadales bacterium]|nr:glycerophosphodiester phosphodiesterase [Gemmatimonadales bacterium]
MSGRGPLVIAHRGASGYEVENSLAAFRAAGARGADGVELDVHATADGALVVHHDETLDGRQHIAHLSRDEVRRHRLPNGEPVPTLEEALDAIGPAVRAFVEVKTLAPRYDDRLLETLDRGPNPGGYAVHSFDHRIVRRLGERRPGLPRGVLSSSYLVRPLAALEDAGASVLWQERTVVDRALVDTVHGSAARIFVWTVDREEEMRRFVALGVDGIVTDYPDVARRVVEALDP